MRLADVRTSGPLVLIGGREDKEHEREVLRAVAARVGRDSLVVCTIASRDPDPAWQEYDAVFADLGVRRRIHLTVGEVGGAAEHAPTLADAGGVFFTGGDQVRLTSLLSGTNLCDQLLTQHQAGMTIAGTSAGASVVGDTMVFGVIDERSSQLRELPRTAPGLGFIDDVIVDQHFAERCRIGRLLAAVAQNSGHLGIGIDEDTACIIEGGCVQVIGSGAVYMIDGHRATDAGVTEAGGHVVSRFDIRLHVLVRGDTFNLSTRRPASSV